MEEKRYNTENIPASGMVFMGSKLLLSSLKDSSIMAELLEETDFIFKTIKVTQDNLRFKDVEKEIGFSVPYQDNGGNRWSEIAVA